MSFSSTKKEIYGTLNTATHFEDGNGQHHGEE